VDVTVLALQFGGFAFIAIFFAWVLKSMLAERQQDRNERANFVTATLTFSNVVENHMEHMTQAVDRLSVTMEEILTSQKEAEIRMNERGKIIENVMKDAVRLSDAVNDFSRTSVECREDIKRRIGED
jgi:hypothetical protein